MLRKKILVTGGAGFIGSNLITELLADARYEINCLDNFDDFYNLKQKVYNIKPFNKNQNFKFFNGNINCQADLEAVGPVDTIIHLAAKAGIRPSIVDPGSYYEVNVMGTQKLLDFAVKHKIKQFICASSSSIYGLNKNFPWKEEDILYPISPYASSKIAVENLGYVYSHLYGINFTALRLFTVYGPAQRPDLAIHKFFHSIINKKQITLFGDGFSSRDYTYVDDVVNGIVKAMNYTNSPFEVFNIGNNTAVTLLSLLNAIGSITGQSPIIDYQPSQPGEVLHTCGDISKARKYLNYNPETKLIDGLTKFYDWYSTFHKLR